MLDAAAADHPSPPSESAVLEAIGAVADETDPTLLLASTLDRLRSVLAFTGGSVVLVEGDDLVVRAAVGPFAERALGQRLPRGRGRMWQVVEDGQPLFSDDLLADGLRPTTPVRSYLAVPLVWQGTVFGALEVDSTDPGAFTRADLLLLQRVAGVLSGALAHARVQAVADRRHAQLRGLYELSNAISQAGSLRETYDAAVRGLVEGVGVDRAALLAYDDAGVMRFVAWHGLSDAYRQIAEGHSPWGRDDPDPRPVLVTDVRAEPTLDGLRPTIEGEGIRALGFVPLVYSGRLLGKFMLYYNRPHVFADEEVRLAATIAHHVAFALERRRADEALRRSEARNRALLDAVPDLLFRISADGVFLDFKASREVNTVLPPEAFLGRTLHEVVPTIADRTLELVRRALATGQPQAFEYRLANAGEMREYEARLVASGADEALAIVRDVTERKRAEAALRVLAEAGAELSGSLDYESTLVRVARLAVPALADACVMDLLDHDGHVRRLPIVHADPGRDHVIRLIESFGPPRLDGPGAAARVLRTGEPYFVREITPEALADHARDAAHLRLLEAAGLRSSVVVPLLARGQVLGCLTLVTTDISSRIFDESDLALAQELAQRAAQAIDNARLYQAEFEARARAEAALRMRDEFLSIAAHELKTPITALGGLAELALRRMQRGAAADPRSQGQTLERISLQAARLGRLVGLLLDVSRLEAGRLLLERGPVDLSRLVDDAVAGVSATAHGHRFDLRAPAELWLEADAFRLEQVLANLLDNAVKYSPLGGTVEVELWEAEGAAQLSVRDHGLGIPPEHRARIFDRYYQAHAGSHRSGVGLGLYISQQIVELHGGHIRAEFPDDGGTRFVVTLPLDRQA